MAVICKLLYPMRSSGKEETDDVSYLVLFWIVFRFCFFFLFCFVFVRLQFLLIKWTFKIILFSAIKHSQIFMVVSNEGIIKQWTKQLFCSEVIFICFNMPSIAQCFFTNQPHYCFCFLFVYKYLSGLGWIR